MESLKTAFSKQEFLFGTPSIAKDSESSSKSPQRRRPCIKVGVVTCLEGRNQPCLLANYSRNRNERGGQGKLKPELSHLWSSLSPDDIEILEDHLSREDERSNDFRVWEA